MGKNWWFGRVYTRFSYHMQVAIESSHYRVRIYEVSESSIRYVHPGTR